MKRTDGSAAIAPEDEARPVVGFLRMAGWSDEKIAEVVAAHKRGETPTYSVTIGGTDGEYA